MPPLTPSSPQLPSALLARRDITIVLGNCPLTVPAELAGAPVGVQLDYLRLCASGLDSAEAMSAAQPTF